MLGQLTSLLVAFRGVGFSAGHRLRYLALIVAAAAASPSPSKNSSQTIWSELALPCGILRRVSVLSSVHVHGGALSFVVARLRLCGSMVPSRRHGRMGRRRVGSVFVTELHYRLICNSAGRSPGPTCHRGRCVCVGPSCVRLMQRRSITCISSGWSWSRTLSMW